METFHNYSRRCSKNMTRSDLYAKTGIPFHQAVLFRLFHLKEISCGCWRRLSA
ncbi:MAG: hypothetical protein ACLT3Y_10240 [Ruminococcus callidus]